MYDCDLPESFPEWLRKDVVSTRHEVPAARGRSHTVFEKFYTPRVFRWALNQWFERIPLDADPRALRNALPQVLADPETFFAYLTVPDAFAELYESEHARLSEDRVELERVKRVMRIGRFRRSWSFRHLVAGLLVANALVAAALLR